MPGMGSNYPPGVTGNEWQITGEGGPMDCDRCGESMEGCELAEVASTPANPDFDPAPDNMTAVVHAEPCAAEMLASGQWEIA